MSQGNLSRPGAGSFRGSVARTTPAVTIHYHDGTVLDVTPRITELTTSKTFDTGTWAITLVGDIEEIPVGAWVQIAADVGGQQWLLMAGMVTTVSRTRQSPMATTWSISGTDLAEVFDRTEVISMPWMGFDPLFAAASFYSAVLALSTFEGAATPGQVVKSLIAYMLRSDYQRGAGPWWEVPSTFPVLIKPPIPQDFVQFADILSLDYIDEDLQGSFASYGTLLGAVNSGSSLWELIKEHANTSLNECFYDIRPSTREEARSALAYRAGPAEAFRTVPALVIREKPFPRTGLGPDEQSPWDALPTTRIHIDDCDTSLTRSDDEKFNYFFLESGSGYGLTKAVLGLAAIQGGPGTSLLDGVPAVDRLSAARHGLRRMELSSAYINLDAGNVDIYVGWTKLIRDWYAMNHLYLSGDVDIPYLAPGIRVGEKLMIDGMEADPVEFYVEGVMHTYRASDGAVETSTEITVTRGMARQQERLEEYLAFFEGEGRSVASPRLPQGLADLFASSLRVVEGLGITGLPAVVEGTSQDGESFVVPEEDD